MDATFSNDRLRRLGELEDWHFWFAARRAMIERLLDRYLASTGRLALDVGCGTGRMLDILAPRFDHVVGIDLNPDGLHAFRRGHRATMLMRATATRLPVPDCAFAAVLLLDVLEHVDDHAALAEVYRVLRPDGIAVLSVPALRWLWSYRDVAAGHLRRYGRLQFRDTIVGAGLSILTLRYYQCLLTPFVTIARLLGRRGPYVRDLEERPSSRLNSLLMRVNLAEVRLGDTVAWPWGTSLVAVCGKAAA